MASEILLQFVLGVVRIILAIVFSAGALYTGINLLDRLTPNIDEWKEIKKGNIAVGIFYAVVMISLIIMVAPAIGSFLSYLTIPIQFVGLALSFVNYLLALFIGIFVIYLTIHIIDRLTHDLDEMEQLQKGNVAVALLMSAVLISVVYVASLPLESIFDIIKSMESLI